MEISNRINVVSNRYLNSNLCTYYHFLASQGWLLFSLILVCRKQSIDFYFLLVFAILPYLICMALYVVPIFIIQSFLGQFSSTGFVSALRLSPLFKGKCKYYLKVNFDC